MKYKKQIGFYLEYDSPGYKYNNEELFHQLEECTDEYEREEIKNKIVLNNVRLTHHIIRKKFHNMYETCRMFRITPDDLFSTGHLACMKAINTFDVNTGYMFATYLSRCMYNEFNMFIRSHKNIGSEISADTPISDDNEGNEQYLSDLLDTGEDFAEDITDTALGYDILEKLNKHLNGTEMYIFQCMFKGEGMTQKQIAQDLGLSQSYVSRLQNRIVTKSRKIIKQYQLVG